MILRHRDKKWVLVEHWLVWYDRAEPILGSYHGLYYLRIGKRSSIRPSFELSVAYRTECSLGSESSRISISNQLKPVGAPRDTQTAWGYVKE